MSIVEFLSQPLWQRLGLTLVHFLWQGLAIAILVAVFVRMFRLKYGKARYAAYLLAFIAMIACPVVTFMAIDIPISPNINLVEGIQFSEPTNSSPYTTLPASNILPEAEISTPAIPTSTDSIPLRQRISYWLHISMPWLLVIWMVGVVVLSGRLVMGFAGVCRWRHHLEPLPEKLAQRITLLSGGFGMRGFSRVFISPTVLQTMAVGYLRPMVLLPAAMVAQMQPEMLEAVIAHELAHIRRFDLWINLLQRVVETLLFYHPAVWWLSNCIRSERELCCDELAVKATGERLTYATTLESVSRARFMAKQPILATGLCQDNKPTLSRVRHILGLTPTQRNCPFWLAGVIAVVFLAAIAVPTILALNSQAEEKIDDELNINAEGQKILKQMAKSNRYWLIGPPTEVRDYSYDFNLHSRRAPKRHQDRATGPETIEVENPSTSKKRIVQGIRYSSVLQKLAINPSAVTITKVEHDKTKGRIRLDFTLSEPARVECGNGISGQYLGYFGMNVSNGSLWLDAKKKDPIELKAEDLTEQFSEYVEAGKSQYVPLRIGIHRYRTDDTGQDRSMHFDFKFNLFGPSLWLFDQSSYRQGNFDLPFSDKPLVAYTSNIKINSIPRQKTDIDVKSSKAAARSNLKELDLRSQSVHDLTFLKFALKSYTRDHDGKYPVGLEALKEFAEDFPWILENIKYLGKGKTVANSPDTIIAYDNELFNKIEGTNVLLNDSRILYLGPEQLERLGITKEEQIKTEI